MGVWRFDGGLSSFVNWFGGKHHQIRIAKKTGDERMKEREKTCFGEYSLFSLFLSLYTLWGFQIGNAFGKIGEKIGFGRDPPSSPSPPNYYIQSTYVFITREIIVIYFFSKKKQ